LQGYFDGTGGESCDWFVGVSVGYVCYYAAEVRVVGVFMVVPVVWGDVDFDIALNAAAFWAEEEDGVEEVGAGFLVPAAWVNYGNCFAFAGGESFGA